MNHAVTVGGLLLALGIIGGAAALPVGFIMFMAGMMSGAGGGDTSLSNEGCVVFVAGALLLVGCLFKAVF